MCVRVCYLKPEDDDVINTLMSSINIELYETYFDLFACIVIFRQVYYLINKFISINIELFGTYFDLFAFILIFRQVYYFKNISGTYFVLFAFIVIFRQVFTLKKYFKKFVPTRIRTWVGWYVGKEQVPSQWAKRRLLSYRGFVCI